MNKANLNLDLNLYLNLSCNFPHRVAALHQHERERPVTNLNVTNVI